MIDLDDLQLSGTENVHLLEDGFIQIFGIKIADTEAEHEQEVVGIQYPPEFAIQLLDWLKMHEETLMECCGADIPSTPQNPLFDAIENVDFDDDDPDWEDEEDDPYAPGYDPQD
jgi:hypothetical protein